MENLWLNSFETAKKISESDYCSLCNAANSLYPNGLYDNARHDFEIISDSSTSPVEVKKLAELGLADLELLVGDMGVAKDRYTVLFSYFTIGKDPGAHVLILKRLAWIAGTFDDYTAAQKLLDKGFKVASKYEVPYSEAFLLYAQAMLLYKQGNYASALSVITECEKIRWNISDTHGIAAARVGMSKIHCALGHFSRAFECMHSSLEIFKVLNNQACVAAVSTHMSALAGAVLIERAEHGGELPGCSGGDRGKQIIAAVKDFLTRKPSNVAIFAGSGRSWPG